LELVEAKVKEGSRYNLTAFTVTNLISPANLELIGPIHLSTDFILVGDLLLIQ
jgi:hypothetical protein